MALSYVAAGDKTIVTEGFADRLRAYTRSLVDEIQRDPKAALANRTGFVKRYEEFAAAAEKAELDARRAGDTKKAAVYEEQKKFLFEKAMGFDEEASLIQEYLERAKAARARGGVDVVV